MPLHGCVVSDPDLKPLCSHFLPWGSGLHLHFFSSESIKSGISSTISCEAPAVNTSDVCRKVLQASSRSCRLKTGVNFSNLIKPGWSDTAPASSSDLYTSVLKPRRMFLFKLHGFTRAWCWCSTTERNCDAVPGGCRKTKVPCLTYTSFCLSLLLWHNLASHNTLAGYICFLTLPSCPKCFSNCFSWCEFKSTL